VLDQIHLILKVLDDKKHLEEIKLCASIFKLKENHTYAKQALLKLKDMKGLMSLHVEMQKWDEAIKLVETHPEFAEMLYLPYADWLSLND
jgi:intraflagellar transport protein 122